MIVWPGPETCTMSRGNWQTAAVCASLLAIVGAGYALGRLFHVNDCHWVVVVACFAGVVLAIFALCRHRLIGAGDERIPGSGILIYIVLAGATEQFAWVHDVRSVVIAVAWLIPPAVGGLLLPARGCWLSALACWLLLFGGTAALTYSAWHNESGVGLYFAWLS